MSHLLGFTQHAGNWPCNGGRSRPISYRSKRMAVQLGDPHEEERLLLRSPVPSKIEKDECRQSCYSNEQIGRAKEADCMSQMSHHQCTILRTAKKVAYHRCDAVRKRSADKAPGPEDPKRECRVFRGGHVRRCAAGQWRQGCRSCRCSRALPSGTCSWRHHESPRASNQEHFACWVDTTSPGVAVAAARPETNPTPQEDGA